MASDDRLMREIERVERLRQVTAGTSYDKAVEIHDALAEARNSFGDNLAMTTAWGKLARIK